MEQKELRELMEQKEIMEQNVLRELMKQRELMEHDFQQIS